MPTIVPESPARFIDHSLLGPTTRVAAIERLCEEAVEYGFCGVCVPPNRVVRCCELLYGSDVEIATVIGFPLGYQTLETKLAETHQAVAQGATELDLVIALGPALSQDLDAVGSEIAAVVRAAGDAGVKVILECCYLDDALKKALTARVVDAGAAFVKTSTGFAPSGATVEDVRILSAEASGRIGVKAAGGIRDLETFEAMIAAGATRIGTSSGVAIMQAWEERRRHAAL